MDLFDKALMFALKAHEGQTRKNSLTPYILHPCEAAAVAATLTDDREILAAVVLHDTVEDTDATIEEIRSAFGERVAAMVEGETEPPYPGMTRAESWLQRKQESVARLKTVQDDGVKIMWLADKVSNLRSFRQMQHREGDSMWRHFNQQDKTVQERYYRSIADALKDFDGTDAYRELLALIQQVFGGDYES